MSAFQARRSAGRVAERGPSVRERLALTLRGDYRSAQPSRWPRWERRRHRARSGSARRAARHRPPVPHRPRARARWPTTSCLPGDLDRTERIATLLDDIEVNRQHREFSSVTGSPPGPAHDGGLHRHRRRQRRDRPRRAPGHHREARPSSASAPVARCARTSRSASSSSPPARSVSRTRRRTTSRMATRRSRTTRRCWRCSKRPIARAMPAHLGLTATAPGFYGAQGRPIPQLPLRFPDMAERMARQGVVNFEMEASAVLTLAALAGCRAGVICTVFAQRTTGRVRHGGAEDRTPRTGSSNGPGGPACARRDGSQLRARSGEKHWRPSHWAPRWQPSTSQEWQAPCCSTSEARQVIGPETVPSSTSSSEG